MADKKKESETRELSKWVGVYRKSSGTIIPYKVPRSHLRFNPDLRVIPSDPSRRGRLNLTDPGEESPGTSPGTGDTKNTDSDPSSGSDKKGSERS